MRYGDCGSKLRSEGSLLKNGQTSEDFTQNYRKPLVNRKESTLWADDEIECARGLVLLKTEGGQIVYHPMRCGRNDCPHCLKVKGRKAYHRAMGYAKGKGQEQQAWALTLTFRGRPTMSQASGSWNRLRLALSRLGMEEYFRAREFQKRGSRHEHVMMWAGAGGMKGWETDAKAKRWLKDNAVRLGYGFMVEAEVPRDEKHVGRYVTKYLSKAIDGYRWSERERIFSFSRGIPPQARNCQVLGSWFAYDEMPENLRRIAEAHIIPLKSNRWVRLAQILERREYHGMAECE